MSTESGNYTWQKGDKMKTVQEVIIYLEKEIEEAYELHDQAKGKDAQKALFYILKATTLLHVLEEIKQN